MGNCGPYVNIPIQSVLMSIVDETVFDITFLIPCIFLDGMCGLAETCRTHTPKDYEFNLLYGHHVVNLLKSLYFTHLLH